MPRSRQDNGVREQVLDLLLSKVEEETYPSASTLDLIEQLLTPDDKPAYAEVLMTKIRADTYPSTSMMSRLVALG
jgi:hypothetical protein